jgi:hypothetical protein
VNSSTTEAGRGGQPASPLLSVIVASFSDATILEQCLAALAGDAGARDDIEIIVVRDAQRADDVTRAVRQRCRDVRFVDAPPGTTVPRLRTLGIAAAHGEAVALLEDDCVVRNGWCDAAIGVTAGPHVAIAGAVEPGAYARSLDWAVYFCEYARFMLPLPTAVSPPLPGNNAAYKRSALAALPAAAGGFQEVFAQAEWQHAGLTTGAADTLVVHNINRWPVRQLTAVPFHHARAYAARRFHGRPLVARASIAAMTLALPALKVVRLIRETADRGRLLGRLIRSLPWVVVFTTSWSAGEIAGLLAGPGRSAAEWR